MHFHVAALAVELWVSHAQARAPCGVELPPVAAGTGWRARSWTTATTPPLLETGDVIPTSDSAVPTIVTSPAPKPTTVLSFVIGWWRTAPMRDLVEAGAGRAGAGGRSAGSSAASSLTRRPYGESPRCG